MRYGSLFSGYGGLDLAVESVLGATCAWHSEVDPHASKLLAAHWPGVPNLGDITAIDWNEVEPVDLICGGFPCQDISSAGRGAGIKEGTRSGLWHRYADAVRVLRPRFVFVENVGALVVRGLNIVVGDLAALGYDTEWLCLRASDVGAPHRRERVFLLAWPAADAGGERFGQHAGRPPAEEAVPRGGHVADDHGGERPDSDGWAPWGPYAAAIHRWECTIGRPAPSPADDRGRLNPAFPEWMMGLPAGWVTGHGLPRTAELKAIGNGVCPQQGAAALAMLLERSGRTLAAVS